ncbi:MAG: hypothetical protein ACLFSZ_10095, partial [Puniceicoccaceae bacterium]
MHFARRTGLWACILQSSSRISDSETIPNPLQICRASRSRDGRDAAGKFPDRGLWVDASPNGPPAAARAPFDKLMIHDKHAAL